MRGFSLKREASMHDLLAQLAQQLSTGAEIMSRTLGEDPSERMRLAQPLEHSSAEAAALHRRVTNRLTTSLITPFEADALHALSHSMVRTIQEMERTVALAIRLGTGTFPNPAMEALSLIERSSELTVSASWRLQDSDALSTYVEEMRRVDRHAHSHIIDAITECLMNPADVGEALRLRETIGRIESTIDALAAVASAADLLRVKDA